MTIFDIVLLVIMGGFTLFGLWFGLIHTLGSLIGTIAGAYVASHYYEPAATWINHIFGGQFNLSRVIVFILLFILVNRLVGFIFWIIKKIFNFISIIPFLKSIDHLGGAVLGFVEGVLVLGLTFYFIGRYPIGDWFMHLLTGSKVVPYLVKVADVLTPFLPEILKKIQSII